MDIVHILQNHLVPPKIEEHHDTVSSFRVEQGGGEKKKKVWAQTQKLAEINKDGQFYHFTLYTQHVKTKMGRRKEWERERESI